MYVQNRLDSYGNKSTQGQGVDNNQSNLTAEEEGTGTYNIVVNMKKSSVIIYEVDKDNNSEVIQVFNCSVGKKVKSGKFKISDKYSWGEKNGAWHKYNSRISTNGWIQSVNYSEKYSWTLDKESYNNIGKKQDAGLCILLYAGDAQWIYENCGTGTKVEIVKGTKDDVLPMDVAGKIEPYGKCGWDPTDKDSDNPYLKQANNTIVVGSDTVYVERTTKVKYLNNIIAIDSNGNNVTGKLKYKKFDSDTVGKHKVKFTYKNEAGEKISQTVKFEVIDTTCPKVTLSTYEFEYEVKSASLKDFQTKEVKEAIEKLVKSKVSCDETDVTIEVTAFPKEELQIGDNSVKVVATDASGNIGACEANVELVVEEKKLNEKPKEATTKKAKKEKETTKKNKEETTTAKKKKSEETTSENVQESTSQIQDVQTTANLAE